MGGVVLVEEGEALGRVDRELFWYYGESAPKVPASASIGPNPTAGKGDLVLLRTLNYAEACENHENDSLASYKSEMKAVK